MQRLTQHFFFLIVGLTIGLFTLTILPQAYPGFLSAIPIDTSTETKLNTLAFKGGKALSFALLISYFLILIDFYGSKRYKISGEIETWCKGLYNAIKRNKDFIIQYHPGLKIAILFWGITLLFFLFTIPYHYDEAWSYRYFTGIGWLRTATFYPLPNNHIFYNIITCFFTAIPIGPEISTRLPSLIASLIALIYFLKLCAQYFSKPLTLLLTFIFSTSSPFILYGIQARGYGFITCFAVLQLYAAHNLINGYNNNKFRLLYYFSFGAGLYTIPSYLYLVFPVHLLLFLFLLLRKGFPWQSYIKDNIITIITLCALYGIVIHFNGGHSVFKPNDTPRMDYAQLHTALWKHLNSTWRWLTNTKLSYLQGMALLTIAPLIQMVIRKKIAWLPVVTALLNIAPIGIIYLHRVIPFERTWIYMVISITFGLGFAIDIIIRLIKKAAPSVIGKKSITTASVVTIFAVMLVSFAIFKDRNLKEASLDYNVWETLDKVAPEISKASIIYQTQETLEFYISEQIQYVRQRDNPKRPLILTYENPTFEEDIIIINPNKGINEIPQLSNYKLTGYFNDYYALYLKK